jgi:hypothetical protein
MSLQEILQRHTSHSLRLNEIRWELGHIFCTRNFVHTVEGSYPLEQYLRPVDALLYFPSSKETVLLSEREADGVLTELWKGASMNDLNSRKNVKFINLDRAVAALYGASDQQENIPEMTLTALLLFSGSTEFFTPNLNACLRELLPTISAKKAALEIPLFRGLGHCISRSDLEKICRKE